MEKNSPNHTCNYINSPSNSANYPQIAKLGRITAQIAQIAPQIAIILWSNSPYSRKKRLGLKDCWNISMIVPSLQKIVWFYKKWQPIDTDMQNTVAYICSLWKVFNMGKWLQIQVLLQTTRRYARCTQEGFIIVIYQLLASCKTYIIIR